MHRVRNIEVTWRFINQNDGQFSTQLFIDWYDFADFLKQHQLAKNLVVIKGWQYTDRSV